MRSRLWLGVVIGVGLAGIVVSGAQTKSAPASAAPVLVLETVKGTIEIETYPDDAPKAVEHVLKLVRQGFYRGLRFHWVQPGVIQVGDPASRKMTEQDKWGLGGSGSVIGVAELTKRSFVRGSVGLFYRQGYEPATSDSQIFILLGANPSLNNKYIMIGHVTKGMEVADKIALADMLKLMYVKGETPK